MNIIKYYGTIIPVLGAFIFFTGIYISFSSPKLKDYKQLESYKSRTAYYFVTFKEKDFNFIDGKMKTPDGKYDLKYIVVDGKYIPIALYAKKNANDKKKTLSGDKIMVTFFSKKKVREKLWVYMGIESMKIQFPEIYTENWLMVQNHEIEWMLAMGLVSFGIGMFLRIHFDGE